MLSKKGKRWAALALACAVFSLFGSVITTYVAHEGFSINPIRWLVGIFQYGFSFSYFLLFAILFISVLIYMSVKMNGELEKDDRDFLYSKNGTYGTAKLLRRPQELKGVARVQPPQYALGTILGQMDTSGKKIINQDFFDKTNHRNKHVAIFGASSSGKTFSYVKPFCIQAVRRRESLVITDPKGELYEDTVQYFKDSGYIVRRFDLKQLELSDGWDILGEIRGNPDRADILAKIIWSNISNGSSSGSIFESGPVSLLKAILLRVALDDGLKEEGKQNIGEAYQMLQNPAGEDGLNEAFDPQKLPKKLQVCVGPYMSYKQGSPNMRGNILITLSSLLNVFQSETVRKITSQNDIDLTLPGKKPCVYYCILPDMHSTYNFIGAVFFSFLFLDLVDYADNQPERKCKVPVNFLFDEFANIGTIPEFDKKLATIRSRALNVSIILQDLPQLMGRYPETYQSILSNCATYVNIGCNDKETAEFFSARAGEATIQVRTDQHESREPALKIGNKHSTGEGKRLIFTQDELMTFSMDECLIVWQALYTMRAYKYPFVAHPEANRMKRTSILDYPSIFDDEGRKKLREEEKARVAAYEKQLAEGYNPFAYFGGTQINVSDSEIEQEQKVLWFEDAYVKTAELVHQGKCLYKKLSRKLDKAVKESSGGGEILNMDAITDEETETFAVKTTDVESWNFAAPPAEEEIWSLAPEDSDENLEANVEYNDAEQKSEDLSNDVNKVEKTPETSQGFEILDSMEEDDEDEEDVDHLNDESYMKGAPAQSEIEEDEDDMEPPEYPDDGIITDSPSDEDEEDATAPEEPKESEENERWKSSEESRTQADVPETPPTPEPTNALSEAPSQDAPSQTPTAPAQSVANPQKTKKNKREEFTFNWGILGDSANYKLKNTKIDALGASPAIDEAIQEQLKVLNEDFRASLLDNQPNDFSALFQADRAKSRVAATRKEARKKTR